MNHLLGGECGNEVEISRCWYSIQVFFYFDMRWRVYETICRAHEISFEGAGRSEAL